MHFRPTWSSARAAPGPAWERGNPAAEVCCALWLEKHKPSPKFPKPNIQNDDSLAPTKSHGFLTFHLFGSDSYFLNKSSTSSSQDQSRIFYREKEISSYRARAACWVNPHPTALSSGKRISTLVPALKPAWHCVRGKGTM